LLFLMPDTPAVQDPQTEAELGQGRGKERMANDDVPLSKRVYNWAKAKVGQRVGNGVCADLVDKALKDSGGKTVSDFGQVVANADYVWGDKINLKNVAPGDILQFRDHLIIVVTKTKRMAVFPGYATPTTYEEGDVKRFKRGHHSAIVAANHGKGVLTVFEQHVRTTGKRLESVQENLIYVSGQPAKEKKAAFTLDCSKGPQRAKLHKFFPVANLRPVINQCKEGKVTVTEVRETTITVQGQIWAYRTVPKT